MKIDRVKISLDQKTSDWLRKVHAKQPRFKASLAQIVTWALGQVKKQVETEFTRLKRNPRKKAAKKGTEKFLLTKPLNERMNPQRVHGFV